MNGSVSNAGSYCLGGPTLTAGWPRVGLCRRLSPRLQILWLLRSLAWLQRLHQTHWTKSRPENWHGILEKSWTILDLGNWFRMIGWWVGDGTSRVLWILKVCRCPRNSERDWGWTVEPPKRLSLQGLDGLFVNVAKVIMFEQYVHCAYYVCIYIYTQYIYIYIICILICAGCRNNAFQPAGFADACIIGPKITVNFVWYLGYDSSQQRPEKCMLPRKNGHDDFGSIPLWGWFWSLVLDGCEHGGYPSEFSLGEYADSPVDLGFSQSFQSAECAHGQVTGFIFP